jgi:zinc transport system permease protein
VIAAGRLAWSIRSTFCFSLGIGVASVLAGLTVSFYADLAPGGAIVLLAAGITVLTLAVGAASARH